MSITAMKQALMELEVCEQSDYGRNWVWPESAHPTAMTNVREVITVLRQAIAEAEKQEPVAVWELFADGWDSIADPEWMESLPVGTKLYTTPPKREWVGLTQQDIDIAFDDTQEGGGFNEFAEAIEAKLKEKNI